MTIGRTILLFTRSPEAEARAKHLPRASARLFEGFLLGWQQRAREAGAELLAVTPELCRASVARLLPEATLSVQEGKTFAAKVEAAFVSAFASGADLVLMVGGDSPPLSCRDVKAAFSHLDAHLSSLVLTPADDGGVNAIGFSAQAPRPLEGIAWHGASVCAELEAAAAHAGVAVLRTMAGRDLDTARDLRPLYLLSRTASPWSAFRELLLSILQCIAFAPATAPTEPSLRYFAPPVTRGPPALLHP